RSTLFPFTPLFRSSYLPFLRVPADVWPLRLVPLESRICRLAGISRRSATALEPGPGRLGVVDAQGRGAVAAESCPLGTHPGLAQRFHPHAGAGACGNPEIGRAHV